MPSWRSIYSPESVCPRFQRGQLIQSEIILYVARNNEKQVRGHARRSSTESRDPRRDERVPNASDLSFAQVQFTYTGSQKASVRQYIHRFADSAGARAAVRKENIAYFIFGRAPNPSSVVRPSP